MPQKVRVILLENIPELGSTGDIVTVSEGYARNFLFPHNQAALATATTENANRQQEASRAAQAAARLQTAEDLAVQLDRAELIIPARVKEDGAIFGKITTAIIAKELSAEIGRKFTAKDIVLAQPITQLGEYNVAVSVGENVEANLRLTVKAE